MFRCGVCLFMQVLRQRRHKIFCNLKANNMPRITYVFSVPHYEIMDFTTCDLRLANPFWTLHALKACEITLYKNTKLRKFKDIIIIINSNLLLLSFNLLTFDWQILLVVILNLFFEINENVYDAVKRKINYPSLIKNQPEIHTSILGLSGKSSSARRFWSF